MKLPAAELATTVRACEMLAWDLRECFAVDPKHWWTLQYRRRLAWTLRAVQRYAGVGSHVLDVGCAQGTAAILLAERGYRVMALDADPDAIAYARLRYERGDCTFRTLDAMRGLDAVEGRFDVVLLGEVIEHVPSPGTLLAACRSKLRAGGTLVLTTPNGAAPHNRRFSPYSPAMDASGRENLPSGLGARETHQLVFRMPQLLELLRHQGFHIREHRFLESYIFNPSEIHRSMPLSVATRLDHRIAAMPAVASLFTLRLCVVAETGREAR